MRSILAVLLAFAYLAGMSLIFSFLFFCHLGNNRRKHEGECVFVFICFLLVAQQTGNDELRQAINAALGTWQSSGAAETSWKYVGERERESKDKG